MRDKEVFEDMKRITLIIGPWFQAQNDYIDCYVDQHSKPGHDIENGKFSWFATMAMEIGSDDQKDRMRKNYAKYGKFDYKYLYVLELKKKAFQIQVS